LISFDKTMEEDERLNWTDHLYDPEVETDGEGVDITVYWSNTDEGDGQISDAEIGVDGKSVSFIHLDVKFSSIQ
jgi:hypothetical protein